MVRKLVHDTLIFSLVVLVLLFVCVDSFRVLLWTQSFVFNYTSSGKVTSPPPPLHLYSSIPLFGLDHLFHSWLALMAFFLWW